MTATSVAASSSVQLLDENAFRMLPITRLVESAKNPRKHFDQAKLEQLADNISKIGVLTPMLARPIDAAFGDEKYELAAGHRRFRAAKMAGVTHVPVRIVELDDIAFLEVLLIENLQREDVHELEEAQGYRDLMLSAADGGAGYSAARIAEQVGRSEKYVYDRVKLLQLSPELQEHFLAKRIQAGHAILLARLSLEDQKRASDGIHGGLWAPEHGEQTDIEALIAPPTEGVHAGLKHKSVRELQWWINHHVRFDPTAADVPDLFPETHALVAPAFEAAEKVIPITENHHVRPEAKADGERTYGPQSWKRATKPCDYAVTGVIVVGPGRGQAFKVCTDKQKCRVHWGKEIRAREQRAKEIAAASGSSSSTSVPAKPTVDTYALEQAKLKAQQEEWKRTLPAVLDAVAAQLKAAKMSATGPIADLLVKDVINWQVNKADLEKHAPRGKTAEDLVRHLVCALLLSEAQQYRAQDEFPRLAKKVLGLDVAKVIKGAAPVKAVSAKPAAAPKKPAKAAKNKKHLGE